MFKILIVLILALRIGLFFFPSFQIDMTAWQAWASRLNELGLGNFYSDNYYSTYFPGYFYLLWPMGFIFHLLFPLIAFGSLSFEILIKSVTTIFDMAGALYIYKILLKYKPKFAILGSLFYFANPAIIFNTSVWGQIDGIMAFFLLYASYSLVENKKIFTSNLATSISILIKPQSLALFPLMLVKNFRLIVVPIFLIILTIPFFPKDPFFGLLRMGLRLGNQYPFTSLYAFNLWSIFDWWTLDSKILLFFSYKLWGLIMYLISIFVILFPMLKTKTKNLFYLAAALSFMAFYLFPTGIHERYLLPFLPFILIAAIINKSRLLFVIYILSSLIHLINLWFVYYYYNYVYTNSEFSKNIIFSFINNSYKIFSLILLGSFFMILVKYYKSIYAKKT